MPVKKFAYTDKRRDGGKKRREIVLADSAANLTSRHYQRLVAKIEGKPEERILSYLMLRSLKQARYSTDNVGHFALAADTYTHFTSPIRRYPDLIVHRLLRDVLLGQADRAPGEAELGAIAEECSQSERRAADAERELVEWKKVKFMADRVGEDFDALIISTTKYGLFVELDRSFRRGAGAHRHAARRPVHLPGERPQDRGQAHAARIFDRRRRARDPRPGGRQRAQAAIRAPGRRAQAPGPAFPAADFSWIKGGRRQ